MGPFGKLTSKLKGQQKEVQKNGKQCSDSRSDTQEQGQSEKLQVLATSKAEDALQGHSYTRKGGHSEEKAPVKAGGAFDQQADSVSPLVPSRVLEKGTRRLHEPAFKERKDVPSRKGDNISSAVDGVKPKRTWRDNDHNLASSQSPDLLPIPSPAKIGEGTLEEKGKCSTDSSVKASKTVLEAHDPDTSSLTLFSRGLNPIKTRSGPLYKDALGSESQELVLESKSFSSSRVEVGNWDVYQGRDTKGFDVEGRKKSETIGENLCDGEGHKAAVFTTLQAVELSSKGLEGKNRRKFKADSQKSQRGHSSKRPSDPAIVANLGTSNKSDAATMKLDSFSPTDISKVPLKPEDMLDSKGPSSLLSYLDHEFDERFGVEVAPKPLDVIKEMESPTFHTVPPVFEPRSFKKWPKDIKSFSHELGPRGGRPYDVSRPHSDNDLEELLAALRARFNTAKEEVDADLNLFAADLVEILDRNVDSFPQWKENVEDLLLLARKCTLLSPVDFRRECESIVHDLDEQRQELPTGLLKQLHTRMLFILTRCTRLLQFQKETSPEEEGLHKIQQCLKGVPSVERTLTFTGKRGKTAATTRKLLPEVLEQSARNDVGLPKLKISKQPRKPRFGLEKGKSRNEHLCSPKIIQADLSSVADSKKSSLDIPESFEARSDYNIPSSKVIKTYGDVSSTQLQDRWEPTVGKLIDGDTQMASPSKQHVPNHWTDSEREDPESVICRICEEEVPTSLLEPHSLRCRFADYCDVQGLNLDERIQMLADNLDVIADLNVPKSNQAAADDSPDRMRSSRSNLHECFDSASPQSNDLQGKALEGRYEDVCASDSAMIEDLRGPSLINFKRHLGYKSDQGVASSSAGSGTPRSTLTTPRTSQLDLLYAERNSFAELEDTSEIYELAGIARNIANKSLLEEGALEMLVSCLEELHELLARNKVEALTVDTFGRRIEKLLREKIYMINGSGDHKKTDSMGSLFEDDGMSTDDGVHSFKSTPTHSSHGDRITIEDFEILKLISRGAFGRVFLARKRTTGDLFAIKVLRKIDMIRKNAVENILAERDILISVCNPFVVRFFYSFTCRDNLYLVMEYLNGGDLYSLLRHLGCLNEDVARVYIAELVLALEYLHSRGVVHRDLKPDNILIARDGHIKLTDFGLSKVGLINSTDDLSGPGANGPVLMDDIVYGNDEEHALQRERRKERSAVGTPDYLAPEILLGTEHGYTADWWSVGVILFECLTGVPPFNAEHPQIIFDNILNRKIPWPQVPEEMSYDAKDLIDKLLTEDPNERLGAKGASEVINHVFFKDISWDSLARQKAAFVPSPESVEDTSYFTSRYLEAYAHASQAFGDSSDCSTSCSSSNSLRVIMNEGDDECGDLAEFERSPSVEQTFNKFSFKNLSQLVSMNYDLLSQTGRDSSKGHSRNQSAS